VKKPAAKAENDKNASGKAPKLQGKSNLMIDQNNDL
jgi:hypothetical protein